MEWERRQWAAMMTTIVVVGGGGWVQSVKEQELRVSLAIEREAKTVLKQVGGGVGMSAAAVVKRRVMSLAEAQGGRDESE